MEALKKMFGCGKIEISKRVKINGKRK